MKSPLTPEEQKKRDEFAELASSVKEKKAKLLQNRLASNPSPSLEENALGAFWEMYEPHLVPIVKAFLDKGHIVEPSSGFGKDKPECQILFGTFFLEDRERNILTKIGVTMHKETNTKFMKFYPQEANIESIVETYKQIIALFPTLKRDIQISQTSTAKNFRRTYTPQDSELKNTRLFEILMFDIQEKMKVELEERLRKDPKPTKLEINLGVFLEKLEPQVRDAVIEFQKKGYATDASGFLGRSDLQSIEGDFTIDPSIQKRLESDGVTVITNNSGYTSIQFQPKEPNFESIKKKWLTISSLLPQLTKPAALCMTVRAREFRKKNTA